MLACQEELVYYFKLTHVPSSADQSTGATSINTTKIRASNVAEIAIAAALVYDAVSGQPTTTETAVDTQIRPPCQLSGTVNETEVEAGATQLSQIQQG